MNNTTTEDHDRQINPTLHIECYAGHRADTEPRCLHIGKRQVVVTEVIDRWLDPTHRYFKLHGDDGGIYLVRNNTDTDQWELTLFDSGIRDETRLFST